MHRKTIAIIILTILGAAIVAGEVAFAQPRYPIPRGPVPSGSPAPPPAGGGVPGFIPQRSAFGTLQIAATLGTWKNVLWAALTLTATIMFLIGGFRYLTSQGDSEKVKTATKTIVFGLLALAVGLVASGLLVLVNQLIAS